MRKVYRYEDNASYWDKRWADAKQDALSFTNLSIYPIKYAEMVMKKEKSALEIGCGLGRLLKHYHYNGYNIEGIERSWIAIEQIKKDDPSLKVQQGDALDLPYNDSNFDIIMAFGVYHNLDEGLDQGISEAARVLKSNGMFVISMRPDNIEMCLNEWYWLWKQRHRRGEPRKFHKILVDVSEFSKILESHGLKVDSIFYAKNVSFLYRIPILQSGSKTKTEKKRRAEGYKLNSVGRWLDKVICRLAPYQSANVLVYVGNKV